MKRALPLNGMLEITNNLVDRGVDLKTVDPYQTVRRTLCNEIKRWDSRHDEIVAETIAVLAGYGIVLSE
jgi:hypothetical protein